MVPSTMAADGLAELVGLAVADADGVAAALVFGLLEQPTRDRLGNVARQFSLLSGE